MGNADGKEACECGNVTYLVEEHFLDSGEKLQNLLEKITISLANEFMGE